MKPYITWILILLSGWHLQAQDMHSSQFYSMPSNINPAFTGFFTNDYYAAASYKTQWGSVSVPYQTVAADAEISLLKNKKPNSIVGIGASFLFDKAGTTNFTTGIASLNVSFLQGLDSRRRHIIGVGFQNSFVMQKFDMSKATFENQFNGYDGFNQAINPNESGLHDKNMHYNLAIGGLYLFAPKEHNNFYLSFSAYNLLAPNMSFYDGQKSNLQRRFVGFAGGEVTLKGRWSMVPSAMYQMQGPSREIIFGTFARYSMERDRKEMLAINIGAWYRVMDAVIPAVKLEYRGLTVTANFDVNISKLTKVSKMNGGGEISVSYSGNIFKKRVKPPKRLECPSLMF
jgi:type IX secretion system PorP/SprF family membrane protein